MKRMVLCPRLFSIVVFESLTVSTGKRYEEGYQEEAKQGRRSEEFLE